MSFPALSWFSPPTDRFEGRLNLCYNALDRQVIGAAADRIALAAADAPPLTYARLLERVAAWAGAVQVLGVTTGTTLEIRRRPGLESVVALLAAARIGAVAVWAEPAADDAAPVDSGEVNWADALAAGRLEPAGCAALSPSALILPGVSLVRLAEAALDGEASTDAARWLGPLLRGETLHLDAGGRRVL
jgi:non-ribosomal peptide synthetase component F